MSPPYLLALDTATDTVHVGLAHGHQVWAHTASGGAQASQTLLPAVQSLLGQAGIALSDLKAIAVGRGPGAFTGLRTACAMAQGLALGLDIPVIVVDTLLAVAESARQHGVAAEEFWVVSDARMGEVYAATYAWQTGTDRWVTVRPPALWTPAAWQLAMQAVGVDAPDVRRACVGNGLKAYPDLRGATAGPDWTQSADAVPDGAALAHLARVAWARGEWLDAAQALPLYVRDKVAQTTAEREQARQLQAANRGA